MERLSVFTHGICYLHHFTTSAPPLVRHGKEGPPSSGGPSLLGAQPYQEQWLHQAVQLTPCSSILVLSSHFELPQFLYDSGIPFPVTKKNERQNFTKTYTLIFYSNCFFLIKAEMSINVQQVNVQASCNGYLHWHTT